MASLGEGYCSLIIRASQFSSTTRNLVPRFKRGARGKEFGYEFLTVLLGVGCSSRRGSFLCFSHHDEVGVLSTGLRRTYEDKGIYERTDLYKVAYPKNNIKEGGGK